MEEFRSVSLNEAYTDVVPSQAMCRVHEPTFLPNMHSRVLLSIDHSLPNSECLEFANANFIRGHNLRSNAFIATQNPTPEGVEVSERQWVNWGDRKECHDQCEWQARLFPVDRAGMEKAMKREKRGRGTTWEREWQEKGT